MTQTPSGISTRELRILASIRESFETAIAAGEECLIEERLELVSSRLRKQLVQDLLVCELQARGPAAGIDEYLTRFPEFESQVRSAFEASGFAAPEPESDNSALDATRVFDREELKLEEGRQLSATPEQIDRYVIEETLGHGGMGVVYLSLIHISEPTRR